MLDVPTLTSLQGQILALQAEVGTMLSSVELDMRLRSVRAWLPAAPCGFWTSRARPVTAKEFKCVQKRG
jgi:hypothetical protein